MASDSTLQWFVRVAAGERGPFTAQQLKAFAAAGKITHATSIRRGDMSGWVRAGGIKGLFAGDPAVAAAGNTAAPTSAGGHVGGSNSRPVATPTVPTAPGAASLTMLACSIVGAGLMSAAIVSRFL
jgi:hypothetical protein